MFVVEVPHFSVVVSRPRILRVVKHLQRIIKEHETKEKKYLNPSTPNLLVVEQEKSRKFFYLG